MLKISSEELKTVATILSRYLKKPDFEILVFGSRVVGTPRADSDLDIAIRGKSRVPPRSSHPNKKHL